jgi:hypothetical protein
MSHGNPACIKTFNMYTCKFGTKVHPSPDLPRRLKETALRLGKQKQPFVLDFSLHHCVVERCPTTIFDEDFEIVFGGYGYVVWAFDDTRLPVAGSLSDLSMDVAPASRPLPLIHRPTRSST